MSRVQTLERNRRDFGASRSEKVAGLLDSSLLAGLSVLLVFGPLAFGAVESWSTFVVEAGSATLFLLWVGRQALARQLCLAPSPLYAPMALFALVVAAQLLLGTTAYRYATEVEALKFVAYAFLVFLVVQRLRHDEALKKLALVLAVFGFLLAVFALAQDLTSSDKLYWVRKPRMEGWLYGPYVNHNHYAGLMELLAPIPLVLGLARERVGGKKALLILAFVFMAVTIFTSGSRGGMVSFAAQMVFLGAVTFRGRAGRRTATALCGIALLTAGLLVWLDSDRVSQRFQNLDVPHRVEIVRDSVRMVQQRPILGWGLGTFPAVYPRFRSFFTDKFVNQAHNDYVQLLVETGVLGFAAGLWFVVLIYREGFRSMRTWRSNDGAAIKLAALVGITGLLVHGLVDFNLKIPANAALFFVFCAIAARQEATAPTKAAVLEVHFAETRSGISGRRDT